MLDKGDGVLKGTLYSQTGGSFQGNWFHGVYFVTAPAPQNDPRPWKCTTDFSSSSANNVEYKVFSNLDRTLFQPILALDDGYTRLAPDPRSGALDYVRSPLLGPGGCIEVAVAVWNRIFRTNLTNGWVVSNGTNAVAVLQQQLNRRPMKVYVFGEPYMDPGRPQRYTIPGTTTDVVTINGMHNVHMNQGDPLLSSDDRNHQAEDGIWQDGASIFEAPDGTLSAFCCKFVSQTFNTNDQGLPA